MTSSNLLILCWVMESTQTSWTAPLFSEEAACLSPSVWKFWNSIWLTMSLVFQSRKLRSILHSFLPPPNPDWSPSLVGWTSRSLYIVLLTFFHPSYGAHYLPSHLPVWLLHSPHHPSITPPWSPVAQVKFSSQRTRLCSDWLALLLWISPHSPDGTPVFTLPGSAHLPAFPQLGAFVWILIPSSHSTCHPWGQQPCLPRLRLYLLEHGIYSPNTCWLNKYTADPVQV